MLGYELWNMESDNMVGFYESELEALREVFQDLEVAGRGATEMLGLIERAGPDEFRLIAQGPALIELAHTTMTAQV